MRNGPLAAFIPAAFALLATPTAAQDTPAAHDRAGWWFSFGVAGGGYSLDCTRCGSEYQGDPWRSGSALAADGVLGGALSGRLLAGLHFTTWAREEENAEGDFDRLVDYVAFVPVVQFYPIAGSNLFVRGGAGISLIDVRTSGAASGTMSGGFAIEAMAGRDFWFSRSWAVAPYAGVSMQRLSASINSGGNYVGDATLWKIGVAVNGY